MYMYIYIHMLRERDREVFAYMHTRTHTYIQATTHAYVHTHIHAHMCATHKHICVCACVCVRMCAVLICMESPVHLAALPSCVVLAQCARGPRFNSRSSLVRRHPATRCEGINLMSGVRT